MTSDRLSVVSPRVQFLFHFSSFAFFAYVFYWHFTPEAEKLPQAGDFGWFYKFLTFWGFNFQLVTLFVCVLGHLNSKSEGLKRLANDLSCSAFPLANVITLMYWLILVITMKPVDVEVDGGVHRTVTHGLRSPVAAPWYINLTVHLFNTIIAWVDITICERSFRPRASAICYAFGITYVCWSQYASSVNKMYPYPFLNDMPEPQGYILVSLVSLLAMYSFLRIGAGVTNRSATKSKAS
ncbi:hypothetical protein R1sor_021358 [Riccia sorocarpa]|uniref:Uncharacterized protein n=1 Tax=Riccia sorocarpa TaxID=122646 RepID=A0ABD3GIP3_9MARC